MNHLTLKYMKNLVLVTHKTSLLMEVREVFQTFRIYQSNVKRELFFESLLEENGFIPDSHCYLAKLTTDIYMYMRHKEVC